jgi:putative intracellular protease/amidase
MLVANDGFFFQEYDDPRFALESAGVEVVVASGSGGVAVPHSGSYFPRYSGRSVTVQSVPATVAIAGLSASVFDAMVISGGWGATSYFDGYPGTADAWAPVAAHAAHVSRLIGEFLSQQKHVLAICNGVSVLAWSRVNGLSPVQGRAVRAPWGSGFPQTYAGRRYGTSWHVDSVCPWEPGPADDNCFRMGKFATDNGAVVPPVYTEADRATAWVQDGLVITAQDNFAALSAGQHLAQLLSTRRLR